MDQNNSQAIVAIKGQLTDKKTNTVGNSIYNYINMAGIRQFLVYHPKLLLMFEILVNHIDDYINHRVATGKDPLNNSSHI